MTDLRGLRLRRSGFITGLTGHLELGVLQRREGLTLLGAALIDDAVVILLLSLFIAINPGGIAVGADTSASVVVVLLRIAGFLVVGSLANWFLLPRLVNWVNTLPISQGALMVALVSALLSASAEIFGGCAVFRLRLTRR